MRRPSALIRRDTDADLNAAMTPMIDVVFLLLVFFVWTASFQIVEQILPTQMSSQLGSEPAEIQEPVPEDDFEDIVIRIGWDNGAVNWAINDQPVGSLAEVETSLRAVAGVKQDAPVILHPDGGVPVGDVIDVYDLAKLTGFAEISFAVNPANL